MLRLRTRDGWVSTPPAPGRTSLDGVPLPARDLVSRHRNGYHCLLFKPVGLVETARGCPHRLQFLFCVQLYGRSFRERSIGAVVEDFATAGDSIFVADDLFWPPRGAEPRTRGCPPEARCEKTLDPRADPHRHDLQAARVAGGVEAPGEGLHIFSDWRPRPTRACPGWTRTVPVSESVEACGSRGPCDTA